jgi:uncharacterized protein YjbI with pentapeptide repeats
MYLTLLSNSVMAANFTMYCLEQITDYFAFERLCHDLMVLEGYSSIEPLGGFSDKGRDAIHVSQSRETTIFAYSVREDWRKKLEEDAEKIYKHRHTCDQIVFMTTAEFTAGERDRAVQDIRDKFSWSLQLFGAERLRILLETKHPEIKENHPQIFPPLFLNNQSELNRLSEQFTKAVEQLTSPEIRVRWVGIDNLKRIAKNSKDYHWTIMEVLTAFVREPHPLKAPLSEEKPLLELPPHIQKTKDDKQLQKLRIDIQAALIVIGGRDATKDPDGQRLDLRNSHIRGANLIACNLQRALLDGANLQEANLTDARLEEAKLPKANLQKAELFKAKMHRANLIDAHLEEAKLALADLQEADLWNAQLQGTLFQSANLTRAKLPGANLQGARLIGTNLQGASFYDANLQESYLREADLRRARLDRANLQGADLSKANLEETTDFIGVNLEGANLNEAKLKGADLRGAKNLRQQQIERAFGDKNTTRLPEELQVPEHWTESE